MKQQVNIKVNIISEFDAKYSKNELMDIIQNRLKRAFGNYIKMVVVIKEEAQIYGNK